METRKLFNTVQKKEIEAKKKKTPEASSHTVFSNNLLLQSQDQVQTKLKKFFSKHPLQS